MAVVRTFIRASKDKYKETTPQNYYTGETRLLFYYIYIAYQKAGDINDFYHQQETHHLMSNARCIG